MGVRGSPTGEIVLDDCIVPAANLVGEEGAGFEYAMGRSTARVRS
jgi:alkylation response protein AidB-like acyl-CoA dehydrogenase